MFLKPITYNPKPKILNPPPTTYNPACVPQVGRLKPNWAFTIMELLVVVFIIGILSLIVFKSVSSSRSVARDSLRVNDVKSMREALELYFAAESSYPTAWAAGQPLIGATSGRTYLAKRPAAPMPWVEGVCTSSIDYVYSATTTGYTIQYCLVNDNGQTYAGYKNANANELTKVATYICVPDCTNKCTGGSDGCGGVCSGTCSGTDACCKGDGTCGTYAYNTVTAASVANASYVVCNGNTYNSYYWGCMRDATPNRWINGTACTGCKNVTQGAFHTYCVCCGSANMYWYTVQCRSNTCQ